MKRRGLHECIHNLAKHSYEQQQRSRSNTVNTKKPIWLADIHVLLIWNMVIIMMAESAMARVPARTRGPLLSS